MWCYYDMFLGQTKMVNIGPIRELAATFLNLKVSSSHSHTHPLQTIPILLTPNTTVPSSLLLQSQFIITLFPVVAAAEVKDS